MEEELGVGVDPDRFLGQLPTVQTILGGHVIWGMTAGVIRCFCTAWKKPICFRKASLWIVDAAGKKCYNDG